MEHPGKLMQDLRDKLQQIYASEGSLETTCCRQCTCCRVACPSMKYSEAINLLNRMWETWTKEAKKDFLLTCVRYFFSRSLIKPCPLLKGNDCQCYEDRPLNCFLPDTWVFTLRGPKRIKDILAGEFVFGKDGLLHSVLSTRSRFFRGWIYNVQPTGTHIPCWSTGDHLWWKITQKDKRKKPNGYWGEAKAIVAKKNKSIGDYLTFPRFFGDGNVSDAQFKASNYIQAVLNNGRLQPFTSSVPEGKIQHSIPDVWPVDDEFLFMIGVYVAEGSASIQSAYFCMNQSERSHLERIEKYLNSKGIPSRYQSDRNNLMLRIDSCLFARLIASWCGKLAPEKTLHGDFFEKLTNSQLMKIYMAWDTGDGRKCLREREYSTTTTSEALAVQMFYVAMSNKLFPRCYSADPALRGTTSYDVHLFPSNFRSVKPGQGTKNIVDETMIYTPAKRPDVKSYVGPVVDLEVDEAESFVTSSGIAHNCRLYGMIPAETYSKRAQRLADRLDLPLEQVPLNTQCPFVRRKVGDPLTDEVIDRLDSAIDRLDVLLIQGGNARRATEAQAKVDKGWNYRSLHDWALYYIFGEEILVNLTQILKRETPEGIQATLSELETAVKELKV